MNLKRKDWLTPALKRHWYPTMKEVGFEPKGRRQFVRVQNGILQHIHFGVSGWGSGDFRTFAAAFPLAVGELWQLSPGIRLETEKGVEMWLPSSTEDRADRSAVKCLEVAREQAWPFFSATGTPAAYAQWLRGSGWNAPLNLGAAEILSGNTEAALIELRKLVSTDSGVSDDDDQLPAEELVEAVTSGTAVELLKRWSEEKCLKFGIRAATNLQTIV